MKIVNPKEQTIRRIDSDSGFRFYEGINTHPDGTEERLWAYPSVTSILGEVYPSGYYLEKFIRDNGEHGRVEFEKAADHGTEVHVAIEKLLNGESVPTFEMSPKVLKCVQSFIDWYKEFQPKILETEQMVVNHDFGYAGALDLYCELDYKQSEKVHYKGKYVIDFKTSKSVHPQHKVQVAAYRMAHGKQAKTAILHLGNTTNKKYSFLEFDPTEYIVQFKAFNEIFHMLQPNAQPSETKYPESFKL